MRIEHYAYHQGDLIIKVAFQNRADSLETK
jgi:hypothetical protein